VYHGLQAVAGLAFGRSAARETEPIRPVPDLYVAALLPFLSPHVAAMVKIQRLTGIRAGELVLMRPCDIDTTGDIWIYEPFDHKNRWRGHRKQIPLGPEAQRLVQSSRVKCAEAAGMLDRMGSLAPTSFRETGNAPRSMRRITHKERRPAQERLKASEWLAP
jgi:integrase